MLQTLFFKVSKAPFLTSTVATPSGAPRQAPLYLCRWARLVRNQEKGVLAKGVSVESSATTRNNKNIQGYWAWQYFRHSERHSQGRRAFCKKALLKTPFSRFLNWSIWFSGVFSPVYRVTGNLDITVIINLEFISALHFILFTAKVVRLNWLCFTLHYRNCNPKVAAPFVYTTLH